MNKFITGKFFKLKENLNLGLTTKKYDFEKNDIVKVVSYQSVEFDEDEEIVVKIEVKDGSAYVILECELNEFFEAI